MIAGVWRRLIAGKGDDLVHGFYHVGGGRLWCGMDANALIDLVEPFFQAVGYIIRRNTVEQDSVHLFAGFLSEEKLVSHKSVFVSQ